jgi:hypothetical protein
VEAAMPTASFLQPLQDVAPAQVVRRTISAADAGGAPPGALDFAIQDQEKDNWCWAAVAASVTDYYAARNGTAVLSQEDVAAAVGATGKDEPFLLSTVLRTIGHLDGKQISGGLLFPDIVTEIKNCKPICCAICWPRDSIGHYVVIMGCHDDEQEIIVLDPSGTGPQNGAFPLASFKNFFSGGDWLNTCKTL